MPDLVRRPFSLLLPPYRQLIPLDAPIAFFEESPGLKGSALVWQLGEGHAQSEMDVARSRPGGVPLMVVLPRVDRLTSALDLLGLVERCRPQTILPFHPRPDADELSRLLRRTPTDLPVEFTDYLAWRGLRIHGDMKRIIRRTIELADDLRSISGLSRGIYLSRRALGRRFMTRGLPVPSHWLQFSRVLRAMLCLQNSDESLFTVASAQGYPDGFALSNQMHRLTGVRPSLARECLGWEWLVEAWLQTEIEIGGLKADLAPTGNALLESAPRPIPRPPTPARPKPRPARDQVRLDRHRERVRRKEGSV